jgi:hypothetical protein
MFECENNLTKLAYLIRKNCQEQFLTSRSDGLQGVPPGWQAIKNNRESFLTSHSDGLQGGRQGWQAINL